MAYFPMFVELEDQNVWIIGGGSVAYRKVQKLLPYGAKITVIATRIEKKLDEISGIIKKKQEFKCSMLREAEEIPVLVIAATDDENLNTEIAVLCKEKRIPVNVADALEKCSFVFPALVKQGKMSAGICTSGVSPTASAYLKKCLEEILPENLDEILDWLEEKRKEIKERIPDQKKRASFQRKLFYDCIQTGRPFTEKEWRQYQD